CHDNLFFDTGVFTPARVFGKPTSGCVSDGDCLSFSPYAMCDTNSLSPTYKYCVHKLHPVSTDDSQCVLCHNESQTGLVPVSAAHEIYQNTQAPNVMLSNVQLLRVPQASPPPSGDPTIFQVGDQPTVSFHFTDKNGPITDLTSNSAYSLTALMAGPTSD